MKKRHNFVLPLDDKLKEKLCLYLLQEGKTLKEGIIEQFNYIIDNNIPIEEPVENFLDIRKKLIEKYGSIKEASKHAHVSYQNLLVTIKKIEKNKNFKPRKSTISMFSDLLKK